ncbi:hypothetical protein [Corynebacterium aurimucosum]|uniref:hypothetical protein n=1 Tax=Corynebacterium aurimucosum TaxID=169292 RepID=UPI00069ED589|nr:hypothetical protein [Corynebacterium aurimucosum]
MMLATLIINGVGEELFVRNVARRELSDVSSPTPHSSPRLLSTSPSPLPWASPLLLVASVLISAALYLVWSTGMAFVLLGLIH